LGGEVIPCRPLSVEPGGNIMPQIPRKNQYKICQQTAQISSPKIVQSVNSNPLLLAV